MTSERLNYLSNIRTNEEKGREIIEMAESEEKPRSKIRVLMGNAPQLVCDRTYSQIWDMMSREAVFALDALKDELEKA